MADFNLAIKNIKKAEGGLSRATTDTASKNPAPWPYKGQSGWHTNKGITYTTFVSNAQKLGYSVTAENFFTMPDSIWLKIYKVSYWTPIGSELVKSQAMANGMVDYAFNFGVKGASTRIKKWLKDDYRITAVTASDTANAINGLTTSGDKDVFVKFIEHRKKAYLALNQPANITGWINRMDELKSQGLSMVTENKGSIAGGLFFLIVGLLAWNKRKEINQYFNK